MISSSSSSSFFLFWWLFLLYLLSSSSSYSKFLYNFYILGVPILRDSLISVTLGCHSLVNDLRTLYPKFALSKHLPRNINWLMITIKFWIKSLTDTHSFILNMLSWETSTWIFKALTCVVWIWVTFKVSHTSLIVVQLEILLYSFGVRELMIIHLTLKLRKCHFLSSLVQKDFTLGW